MKGCSMEAQVRMHFAGDIAPADERRMREHVPVCDACRDLYRRHLVLARFDPAVPSAGERIARGLGIRPSRRGVAIPVVALCVAAAAIALAVRGGAGEQAFAPRGAPSTPGEAPLSRVFVYEIRPGAPPVLASGSVRRGDELAFAYENGARKRRLAIFGVDEHGHVFWFHPAWTSGAEDPVAIPIAGDDRRHELPEAIRHSFDGARLQIRSVFLDDAVSVRRFEELVRMAPNEGGLGVPGALEQSLDVTVTP